MMNREEDDTVIEISVSAEWGTDNRRARELIRMGLQVLAQGAAPDDLRLIAAMLRDPSNAEI
jgi:hypothetical protein